MKSIFHHSVWKGLLSSTQRIVKKPLKIDFPYVVMKNSIRNLAEGVPALVPFHPSPAAQAANLAFEQETHLYGA